MPLTLLDIGLLVVMLISGILAMVRGFMREILSIAAWVIAAGVTLYGYARAEAYVKQYVTNDLVAKAIAIGGLFLITLLIVSILTVKISDLVLDSPRRRARPLARLSLRACAGPHHHGGGLSLLRLAGAGQRPADWLKNARARVVLQATGDWLLSVLPDDPETAILRSAAQAAGARSRRSRRRN